MEDLASSQRERGHAAETNLSSKTADQEKSLNRTMTSAVPLHPSLLTIQWAEAQFKGEQELLSVNSPTQANY